MGAEHTPAAALGPAEAGPRRAARGQVPEERGGDERSFHRAQGVWPRRERRPAWRGLQQLQAPAQQRRGAGQGPNSGRRRTLGV